MTNKTEIYQARLTEKIGCVPDGSRMEIQVIFRDVDGRRALVYFPSVIKYCAPGTKAWKQEKNKECGGCLSLAQFDLQEKAWRRVRGEDDTYINLCDKDEVKLINCLTGDEKKVSVTNGNQRKITRRARK